MRTPSSLEAIVVPVVGETNLLLVSCCMIRPATDMPAPVHRMASRRGSRDASMVIHCWLSPLNKAERSRSATPMNNEAMERIMSIMKRTREDRVENICIFLFRSIQIRAGTGWTYVQLCTTRRMKLAIANLQVKKSVRIFHKYGNCSI